jgi:hypothetical protein
MYELHHNSIISQFKLCFFSFSIFCCVKWRNCPCIVFFTLVATVCTRSSYSPWPEGLRQAIGDSQRSFLPSLQTVLHQSHPKWRDQIHSSSSTCVRLASNSVSSVRLPLSHGFLIFHYIILTMTYSLPESIAIPSRSSIGPASTSSYLLWAYPSTWISMPCSLMKLWDQKNVPCHALYRPQTDAELRNPPPLAVGHLPVRTRFRTPQMSYSHRSHHVVCSVLQVGVVWLPLL